MMVKFNLRILKVRVSFLLLLSIVLIFSSAVFAEETVSAATQQYNQGMDYLNAGQDALAQEVFKNLATDISSKEIVFSSEAGIADVVYRLADCYREAKDDRAIELYQYILSKHPSHSRAIKAQAGLIKCYMQKNDNSKAQAAIEKLLTDYSAHPDIVEVIDDLADRYRKQKDDRAIELYQYILSKHPSHSRAVRAQYGLASCYIEKKEYTKAQAATEKLLADYSAHPDIVEVILDLANKHGSIIELYQHIVSNYPSHDLAVWAQHGIARCYLTGDEYIKAQAAIEKLLTDYSAHPDIGKKVISNIAYIYRTQNKYDRLIALYQYIISKYPSHNLAVRAQAGLARCYIEKKEDTKAQAAIEKLQADYSGHPDIVKWIGRLADKCYEGKGYDRAVQLYQYILSKYPSHNWAVHAQASLARCYIQKNEDVKAQAVDEKLLSNYSDHPDIAECIGAVAGSYRGKKYDRAVELYQFILSKYPSHNWAVRAQAGLARCYIQKNEDVKAQAAVEKLQSNYSDHPNIAECIASVAGSYRSKKYDRAVELYQFIFSKYPSHNWVDQARSDDDIIKVFAKLADSHQKKNTNRAIELYQYILSDHFSDHKRVRKYKMDAQYRSARIYVDRKDYPKAEAAVEKLLANYSDRSEIAEYIGRIAESYPREKHDRATELYQLILSKYPSHNQAVMDIAIIYRKHGNYERSLNLCNRVLDNDPGKYERLRAHTGIAMSYIGLNDAPKVNESLNTICADFAGHEKLAREIFVIGEDYYDKGFPNGYRRPDSEGRENLMQCLAVWNRITQTDKFPDQNIYTRHAMFFSGVAHRYLDNWPMAVECTEKVVNDWPDYTSHWNAQCWLGYYYEELVKSGSISASEAKPKIIEAYKGAYDKYPDCKLGAFVARNLGNIYFEEKDWEKATDCLNRFIIKSPESKYLSEVTDKLKRANEAISVGD